MSLARTSTQALRRSTALPLRAQRLSPRANFHPRFNSTQTNPNTVSGLGAGAGAGAGAGSGSPALVGAAAGATAAVIVGFAAYKISGVDKAVQTYTQTKSYLNSAASTLKEKTPEPNEALEALKNAALHYAAFIPGGKGYVNAAFKDIDVIREKHGDEVNKIVSDTYSQLKKTADSQGMTLDAASKSYEILQDALQKISSLAVDSAQDILNNHPKLKDSVGGGIDNLKDLGDKYGPEAKKQVDEVWTQINDIVKSGVSLTTISKIRTLISEKTAQVQKLGDAAWSKGLETAQPYLDKSPQIKKLVEENKDALKNGDMKGLWEKLKGGNAEEIEKFIKENAAKAKETAEKATGGGLGGFEKYFAAIPGASEIVPQMTKLSDVASKHGDEAEKLLKQTFDDIKQVLAKRVSEAEKLGEKAKKDATT